MVYLKDKKRGFSTFVALMLVAIVTAVAYGVSTIGQKELMFVRAGIGSHLAYISAENGISCTQKYLFNDNSPFTFVYGNTSTYTGNVNIKCAGVEVVATKSFQSNTGRVIFAINTGNSCTDVELLRTFNDSGILTKNTVTSKGYNVSCAQKNTDSKALERGIRREF